MKRLAVPLLFALALMALPTDIHAQSDDFYDEGSVWNMTTIRIDANRDDAYLKRLRKTWGASMQMAKDQGLIESFKILKGNAVNEDDFNLLLLIEFENWASFDPDPEREAKWDAIQDKVVEAMGQEKFDETIDNYDDLREMLGSKTMREITFKQ